MDKYAELFELLAANQHNIPLIQLFYTWIPLHLNDCKSLIANTKLINCLTQLFAQNNKEVASLIGHQLSRLSEIENKLKLLICWTEILFEIIGSILKTSANSWFSSGHSRLQQIAKIFEKMSIFIYLEPKLKEQYLRYLADNPYDIQSWKLPTSSWFSSIFNWGSSSVKKCEWITPLHLIHKQNQNNIWLGWLLIESDTLRTDKIWDEVVQEISTNSEADIESVIKVCNVLTF